MSNEPWQLEREAAERYETCLVPALMTIWTPRTVAAAEVRPGDRVLDVACGTGVATRAAAERAGATGSVTGLDSNLGMLAVARKLRPDLDWQHGDAAALPFPDGSFDRLLCQFALMFFPDQLAALREMRRVLEPGGRLGLAVWDSIHTSPPFDRQAEIVGRIAGPAAAAIVRSPFALSDTDVLARLLTQAEFEVVRLDTVVEAATYPDIDAFLTGEIDATPLGAHLSALGDETYDLTRSEIRQMLEPIVTRNGLTFPIAAHIVSARSA